MFSITSANFRDIDIVERRPSCRSRTLLIADELLTRISAPHIRSNPCQTNVTRRVGAFARRIGQVATRAHFSPLIRYFSYIIFRAAPIPLHRVTV